jgi:hypothetical protein
MACPQLINDAQNYFNNIALTALNNTYREGNATLKNASTSELLPLETESYDDINISTDLQGHSTLHEASATKDYSSSNDNLNYPTFGEDSAAISSQRVSDVRSNNLVDQQSSGGVSARISVAVTIVSISAIFLLSVHTVF